MDGLGAPTFRQTIAVALRQRGRSLSISDSTNRQFADPRRIEWKETVHMPTPQTGIDLGHQQGDDPESDLPSGLSQPPLQALHAAGYTRLDQLATVTESDVLALHGMGPKGIRIIREALNARGKTFADAKSS
jgi:hypothetical protein